MNLASEDPVEDWSDDRERTAGPILRGPVDVDLFRTSVYGARWYLDPLPTDDTWPKTDASWPSVTTIKKAWSKPFRKKLPTGDVVPLDAYWAAEYTLDNLDAITALDREGAMALIATCGKRTLNRAADRGTGVHTVLEDLAAGKQPDPVDIDDAVRPFLPACEAFITDCSPRWLMTEVITISRTLEFGGTTDAIIEIPDLGICLTDWKSRGGDHGAYEEEAAQIGGYSLAEYVVVTNPETGQLERRPLPHLDAGLVVSLTANGYRLYPIDLQDAQEAFAQMRESWRTHRAGTKAARAAIGKPIVLRPVEAIPAPSAPAEQIVWAHDRVVAIVAGLDGRALPLPWPAAVPTFKAADAAGHVHTDAELAAVVDWCDATEDALGFEFAPPAPASAGEVFICGRKDGKSVGAIVPAVDFARIAAEQEVAKAEAKQWTDRAMALHDQHLALVTTEMFRACAEVARCGAGVTMTRESYLSLAAVVSEVTRIAGAVEPAFGTAGCRIVPSEFAADRMVETAGTKAEALARAKRLIVRLHLDIPSPRSVGVAAANPLLAALVAAGHGADTGASHNSESEK